MQLCQQAFAIISIEDNWNWEDMSGNSVTEIEVWTSELENVFYTSTHFRTLTVRYILVWCLESKICHKDRALGQCFSRMFQAIKEWET